MTSDAVERDRALVREAWDAHVMQPKACHRLTDTECDAIVTAADRTLIRSGNAAAAIEALGVKLAAPAARDRALVRRVAHECFMIVATAGAGVESPPQTADEMRHYACGKIEDHGADLWADLAREFNASHPPDAALAQMTSERDEARRERDVATAAERERCAKVCEERARDEAASGEEMGNYAAQALQSFATRIRNPEGS